MSSMSMNTYSIWSCPEGHAEQHKYKEKETTVYCHRVLAFNDKNHVGRICGLRMTRTLAVRVPDNDD